MPDTKPTIDPQTIKAIETVLMKGDRVELIPVKDGVKVVRVKREMVTQNVFSEKEEIRKD